MVVLETLIGLVLIILINSAMGAMVNMVASWEHVVDKPWSHIIGAGLVVAGLFIYEAYLIGRGLFV